MQPFPHVYDASLAGGPDGYAQVGSVGLPVLPLAAPRDFDGPGDAWSPEHLLLASVEGCLYLTFRAIARLQQLNFIRLDVSTAGTVDRVDGGVRFTEVVVKARLTVPTGTDHEKAVRALERAEKACLITASLRAPVRLEATVVERAAG